MDTFERYPFVEDIFLESNKRLDEWLPSLASYYDESRKKVRNSYDKWWESWRCKSNTDSILHSMVDRLATQAKGEFGITIEKDNIFSAIKSDKTTNKRENERFSKWYKDGMKLLLKI
jgi:16S rRNA C1402 (ribose-2'-O) methylase RsmI